MTAVYPATMRTHGLLTAGTLAAALALGACGADNDSSSAGAGPTTVITTATTGSSASSAADGSTATSGSSGSYEIVPDADVAKGLGQTVAKMTSLTAAGGADDGEFEEVHELWESYEGTVKQNEPDDYLTFEEALDSFKTAGKAKDRAKMTEATTKFSTTSASYLAQHPA
jgi:hypothetical protein